MIKELKEITKLKECNLEHSDPNLKLSYLLPSENLNILYFAPSESVFNAARVRGVDR